MEKKQYYTAPATVIVRTFADKAVLLTESDPTNDDEGAPSGPQAKEHFMGDDWGDVWQEPQAQEKKGLWD